jgi:cytochrome c oxidase assembly protein subunit 19
VTLQHPVSCLATPFHDHHQEYHNNKEESCLVSVVLAVARNISNQLRMFAFSMSSFHTPRANEHSSPQRGSFPLDHFAECKEAMVAYLSCMKKARNVNDECRGPAKKYLGCRMDHNLMAPDTMKNLGFHDEESAVDDKSKSRA